MATCHQISSQNLECPICLTLLNKPKLLICSHTFCKDCLERIFQTQINQEKIICPVCRKETPVSNGDVGKLQTNVPLSSLVDEVKTTSPTCSVCETDEKPPAVSYCQDCWDNMCKSCEKDHSNWKRFSNHTVVTMEEVMSGRVPLKRRQMCKKHPNESKEYFCPGCLEYVCFRCGMLEQSQEGHGMVEASVHEEKIRGDIKDLMEKAKSKKTIITNNIKLIESQRKETTALMQKLYDDIDKTYDEYMQLLSERKKAMKRQVQRLSQKFENELQVMGEERRQTICHISNMEELITNGMKVTLEKDSLLAHDMLCKNLNSILGRDIPDDQSPIGVTERAQKISFRKHVKVNELCLGKLEVYTWDLKADVELPKRWMSCISTLPDGRMALGSPDGIYVCSPCGELQGTVLKDVEISSIAFLSDGRGVVLDGEDKMSLYTPQWDKLNIEFQTDIRPNDLTVDGGDNIYVSYVDPNKIQVFTPQGGEAVRQISCELLPYEIFSFRTSGKLILADYIRVVCLDSLGKERNVLAKEGMSAYPTVCQDDSVIVAWVKETEEGYLVSIDRYTRELEHVENLITDFKPSEKRKSITYFLREFKSGEIAIYARKRFHVRLFIFSSNMR